MVLFKSNYVSEQLFVIKIVKTCQKTRLAGTNLSWLVKVGIANTFLTEIENLMSKKR